MPLRRQEGAGSQSASRQVLGQQMGDMARDTPPTAPSPSAPRRSRQVPCHHLPSPARFAHLPCRPTARSAGGMPALAGRGGRGCGATGGRQWHRQCRRPEHPAPGTARLMHSDGDAVVRGGCGAGGRPSRAPQQPPPSQHWRFAEASAGSKGRWLHWGDYVCLRMRSGPVAGEEMLHWAS